jgi:hypothetical protein
MFTAKFEVLGIAIPIGFRSYYDDGFVDSVDEYRLKFPFWECQKSLEGVKGKCIEVGRKIHIFYKNQNSITKNIHLRAHEETHALDKFGRLDLLAKLILLEQGVNINFLELGDEEGFRDSEIDREVRAELGAIYALKKRGFGLDEFKGTNLGYFDIARKYYEARKIK